MYNMNSIDNRKQNFLASLTTLYGTPRTIGEARYTREQCIKALSVSAEPRYSVLPSWLTQDTNRRVGRGLYSIPEMVTVELDLSDNVTESSDCVLTSPETSDTISDMNSTSYNLVMPSSDVSLVPAKNDTFVPWGHFDDINTILASKQFAPVYITGLSGNGKTTMIEQICAASGRDLIRVNITAETDEDDLSVASASSTAKPSSCSAVWFRPCSAERSCCLTRSTWGRSA